MTPKEKAVDNYIREIHNQDECFAFIDGYEKCQEDMIKQDIIKSVCPKCACEPAIRLLGEYHCEMCGHRGW